MFDYNLSISKDNAQSQEGANACGQGAIAVGKGGILIRGNVGGDVIGADGKKTAK